jgi:hypothetical protein
MRGKVVLMYIFDMGRRVTPSSSVYSKGISKNALRVIAKGDGDPDVLRPLLLRLKEDRTGCDESVLEDSGLGDTSPLKPSFQ